MANFENIIPWLLYQEDSKSKPGEIINEGDGAGLTRLGLTQRWHQNDLPMTYFSTMSFKDSVAAAKVVYRKMYWNILEGDQIVSDQVAAPLLSFAVNDTTLIAAEALQRVLGIDPDGHIGPHTLAELNSKDPDIVARMFRANWLGFYQHLVSIAPSKQKFLDGWINRVNFPYPSELVPSIYQ
jgi:lysozyme family protein